MSDNNNLKKIGKAALITGGIVLGVASIPMIMGFGTAGIVGGSIAAGIQAMIGNVAEGSLFAVCTSLGMTGVFASSAAVGAILGIGGLAAYIKGNFSAKNDAELIYKVIKEKDKAEIIIKLIEARFPWQRIQIKQEYEKINENECNLIDILNYIPMNMQQHFSNLMIPTENIIPKTERIKQLLSEESFDKYFEREFNPDMDAFLINEVINRNDEPLIIVRLLNFRDEQQRKEINEAYKKIFGLSNEKNLLTCIIDFMPQHIETEYIHCLLDNIV